MAPKVTDEYKEQKKEHILEAANRVFIRSGYRGVTMKDIIDESGLSRGGVYLYFSSTEEIFLSLIETSDDDYSYLLEQVSIDQGTAWEGLVKLINIVMNNMLSIKDGLGAAIYEYFLVVQRDAQSKDLLKKRFHRALDSLGVLLKKGVEAGEFHPRFSIDEISKFLIFVMDGLSINMINLKAEEIDIEKQVAQVILYLQQALQVKNLEIS